MITEQHKRTEVITQQLYVPNCIGQLHAPKIPNRAMKEHPRPSLSHHALVRFPPGMQDPWLNEPDVIFSTSRRL
ncbi:hypothetical protein TNCV_4346691 [Trichonephila clavipes]|nr:hypothetical protein TNCV_4346691 [Trichonephila clavipes]